MKKFILFEWYYFKLGIGENWGKKLRLLDKLKEIDNGKLKVRLNKSLYKGMKG